jgi:plastocyanin
MRRSILTLAAAAALAAPATASAEDFAVSMPGKFFDPQRLTIVAGDQVSWRNADFVSHEVRATNGAFDSGTIGRQGVYLHRFDTPGSYALVCSIHPFMTGEVDVLGATLSGPKAAVVAGEPVRLEGRAPAGTGSVSLEEQGTDGAWKPVSSTATGADGAFAFSTTAHETASYRAVSAAGTSQPVTVNVSARVDLHVHVHKGHVMVETEPVTKGLVATLQLYSRERFSYRRIAHVKTDRKGMAEFRLRRGLRGTVRVLLSRAVRGPALGVSHAVRLRDGRTVADPMPQPAPPGGHGPMPH